MTKSRTQIAPAAFYRFCWLLLCGATVFGCGFDADGDAYTPGDGIGTPQPGERWVVWRGQEISADTGTTNGDEDTTNDEFGNILETTTDGFDSYFSSGAKRKNGVRDLTDNVDLTADSREDTPRLHPGGEVLVNEDFLRFPIDALMAGDADIEEASDIAESESETIGETLLPLNTADWGEECYRTNKACDAFFDCLVEANSGLSFCSNPCESDEDCVYGYSTGCCTVSASDEQSGTTRKYCQSFCEQEASTAGFGTPCSDDPSVCPANQSCLSDDELDLSFCSQVCRNLDDCPSGTCCVIVSESDAFCAPPYYCGELDLEAPDQTPSLDGELSERACSTYLTHCNGALETYSYQQECVEHLECLESGEDGECSAAVTTYMDCLTQASNVYLCLDCVESFTDDSADCEFPEACAR